jgi:ribonucleoside-diphosphate reductase alpha subunit
MKIIKRNGIKQQFLPNKILNRIKRVAKDLNVNSDKIFQKVIPLIKDGMTATDIDEIIAFQAADLQIEHPDYAVLGGRILISRQAKILEVEEKSVDEQFDSFAASTFLKKYSLKNEKGQPIEIPSMMYNRVANHLYPNSFKERRNLLNELYEKKINFATPILSNSGIEGRNGLISCNLTLLKDDSIDGINETLDKISQGSKEGSGIGLNIDPIRSSRSLVSSFKGYAGGVIRLADMVQSHMRFYKQGNRSGSCALYLSTWHRDINEFLELRLPIGEELNRARDLFTAVTIDDLFMEALINETDYYLFCPNDIKKAGLKALHEVHGEEFREVYNKAVDLGIGYKTEPKKIWDSIIRSQVESGTPYVLFKDNANKKNMQDNIGIISQSNLCAEILQSSQPGYTPQCTLGSINLAEHNDIKTIIKSTKVLTRALNQVININKWSDEWSKNAGEDQRAIAIGVAGLADFFAKKKISFESEEAKEWNEKIFEAMYKAAVTESMSLAIEEGTNYPAWEGSRYSKGETYIEGWSPTTKGEPIPMKNSLLIGLMPTASSAILLGAFECFEPITSNVFTRMVGDGEFIVVNKYLVNELNELGLWSEDIRNKIIANEGSVQDITEIPEDIRYRYKTVWEIPQKALLDLSIIRNKYVDQSQSLNVYHTDAKYSKISSALVYAWKNGLKTGAYYTRTKSKLGSNKKLSASDNVDVKASVPKRPENSMFTCEGGGCSA